MRKLYLILFTFYLFADVFADANSEPFKKYKIDKNYYPFKIEQIIEIDGALAEDIWESAPIIKDFLLLTDNEEKELAPLNETQVKILYDDDYLYFGIILYNKDNIITYKKGEYDDFVNVFQEKSDYFTVEIDTYHNHNMSFGFAVNSSGVKADYAIHEGEFYDDNWNAVWDSKVKINDDFWSIEYKIPFNYLRFKKQSSIDMGINFERYIYNSDEYSVWSMVQDDNENGHITHYGHIKNLNINSTKSLIVNPSISMNQYQYNDYYYEYFIENQDGNIVGLDASSFQKISDKDYNDNLEFKLKYLINSNTSLDFLVNPNFNEIEYDPAEVNNSAFETFYKDKRNFFNDQESLFYMPIDIFYSRRIGYEPIEYKNINTNEYFQFDSDLDGAMQLVGNSNAGFSYGFIAAQSEVYEFKTDNKAYYSIFRTKNSILNGKSYFGFIGTSYDFRNSLSNVLSIDGIIDIPVSEGIEISYQIAKSDHENIEGSGSTFELDYQSNKKGKKYPFFIEAWIRHDNYDDKFNINRLGYLYRNNIESNIIGTSINLAERYNNLLESSINFQYVKSKNKSNVRLDEFNSVNLNFTFLNLWGIKIGLTNFNSKYIDKLYDDYFLFNNYPDLIQKNIKFPSEKNYYFGFNTNQNNKISFSFMVDYFKNELNDDGEWYLFSSKLSPNSWFDLDFSYDYISYFKTYHFLKIRKRPSNNNGGGGHQIHSNNTNDYSFSRTTPSSDYQFIFTNSNNTEKVYTLRLATYFFENFSIHYYGEYFIYENIWLDNKFMIDSNSPDFSYPILDNTIVLEQDDEILYSAKYSSLMSNFILKWTFSKNYILTFGSNFSKNVNGKAFNSLKSLESFDLNNIYNSSKVEFLYGNNYFIKLDIIFDI